MAAITSRLVYDPTSPASSASVGAYLLAGTDGEQIDSTSGSLHVNVTALTASDVDIRDLSAAQDNVAISDGTDTLGVNADGSINAVVSATDLDIRDLSQASDSVAVGDGTNIINLDGSGNVNVVASQLDIDDLNATDDAVAAWCFDGTGNAIGSTGGSLDVNVTNSIDLDDDLADTAIENTATAVSTTAVNVVSSALSGRKWLAYANEGNKTIYFGKTGVTTSNGFPCHMGQAAVWRVGPSVAPQFIGETGASAEDVRVMELS